MTVRAVARKRVGGIDDLVLAGKTGAPDRGHAEVHAKNVRVPGRPAIVDLDARDDHAGDGRRAAAVGWSAVECVAGKAVGPPEGEARLFEIGEIDRVVHVPERIAIAEADRRRMAR